jgi:MoaA/NifB/PqqE/SkfB family radical SAM enzyme
MSRCEVKENLQNLPARYGFYGRMKAEFPSQVIIDVTEVCNLACIHCPQPRFKRSPHYSARCLDPQLSAKAVDEVRQYGRQTVQYLRYTGEGEPLIHDGIYEMLTYAVLHSGTTVTLTTNGTLLNQVRLEKLLATGVNVVDISIDAFNPETYARIRVNGNLEVTRANVLNLIRASKQGKSHLKVVVSFIEQPQNAHEAQDFQAFWEDHGADYVVIRRLHSAAGALNEKAEAMRHQKAGHERYPCTYPWERIVVDPRGHLCFCPAGWAHEAEIADYRTVTIGEMWQSEFYRHLRQAHLSGNYTKHPFCGQCPDWQATRWPDEGRSYANMIEDFQAESGA